MSKDWYTLILKLIIEAFLQEKIPKQKLTVWFDCNNALFHLITNIYIYLYQLIKKKNKWDMHFVHSDHLIIHFIQLYILPNSSNSLEKKEKRLSICDGFCFCLSMWNDSTTTFHYKIIKCNSPVYNLILSKIKHFLIYQVSDFWSVRTFKLRI